MTNKPLLKPKKNIFFIYLLCVINSQYVLGYPVTAENIPSVRRGVEFFINYCSGCHSLKYVPSNLTGKDLLENNYAFIQTAMLPEDAKKWFGIIPPDLSLIAREKGIDWLSNYLQGFYSDNSRPFGVNNRLVADSAMPNILESLAEELSKDQFSSRLQDLLSFLAYVADPSEAVRHKLGLVVMIFLLVFLLVALALRRLYWGKMAQTKAKKISVDDV